MFLSATQTLWETDWVRDLAVPLFVLLLFVVLRGPAVRVLFLPFLRLAEKSGNPWPAELKKSFGRPLRALLAAAGVYAALWICPVVPHDVPGWATWVKCFRSLVILLFSWGLFRLSDNRVPGGTLLAEKLGLKDDSFLLPFLSKIFRFLVAALAALMIAQEWSYSISGLLAGLGLGGLAFALAAQDMLSNLFGGLVIFLDRPFGIGDWIQTGDTEGTVEDINFRSVKIRTFSQAVVTVPNSKLVDRPVTNFSRMGKRRVSFTVGLSYGTTAEQMKACTEKVRRMLRENADIEPETVTVAFDGIGESSLNLMLYFFTRTTDWQKHLQIREEVYYSLLRILEEEKARLAFPTRTVRLENEQ